MNLAYIPLRWPRTWTDPAALDLIRNTPINFLLLETGAGLAAVADEARKRGLTVATAPRADTRIIGGEWPGIPPREGAGEAGPTGVPWLNANAWRARIAAAVHPKQTIWIDAAPKSAPADPNAYAIALADSAAFASRWIISLHPDTAAAIAAKHATGVAQWAQLAAAVSFFAKHNEWTTYSPQAVIAVVSDFAVGHEFLATETVNLLARTGQQYKVIASPHATSASFDGLRAILYVDPQPPSADLRSHIEGRIREGVMLIAGPSWGTIAGAAATPHNHPRFNLFSAGRGRAAIAKSQPDDPYLLANDSVILVSHRYDLLRFFNTGAFTAALASAPAGKDVLLSMVFYADRGPDDATVHITGRYRSATLYTAGQLEPKSIALKPARDGVELHLPPVSQYAIAQLHA